MMHSSTANLTKTVLLAFGILGVIVIASNANNVSQQTGIPFLGELITILMLVVLMFAVRSFKNWPPKKE
jgi:hypothetical protein